jgi:hypothetical protein
MIVLFFDPQSRIENAQNNLTRCQTSPIFLHGKWLGFANRLKESMALEKELATYHARLPELKADEGKFVLVHGDEVAGVFTSSEDAIKIGYEKFKLEPFLVKQIQAMERVQFISRFVEPRFAT